MSELFNQAFADIVRSVDANNGKAPEAYFLSEADWHNLRSEIALKDGHAAGDPDYPLMNFYLHGVRVCIRAPIMEEDEVT